MSASASAGPGVLTLPLDPNSAVPLHRQVYEGLLARVNDGLLRPGTRLPSSRALARQLAVSRNTVLAALEQLCAEGYLETRPGSGHYVTADLPASLLRAEGEADRAPALAPVRWSAHGHALSLVPASQMLPRTEVRPFRPNAPALDAFPMRTWRQIANRIARRIANDPRKELLWEGGPLGYRPLREAVADHLGAARGVRCTAEQVVVIAGSQQGLTLAALLLLEPGDAVWLEDPGYMSARVAFQALGAKLVPVPVDEEGLVVAEGERRAPRARLAYVTPSVQFPLGVTMSIARRLRLLDWAEREGAWVLEDDYDSEYRHAGRPITALHGLDRAGRVIYVGTFSKVIYPSLRLGYMVLPEALVPTFAAARAVLDRHSPLIEQAVLAEFVASGHFAAHLRRMRKLYARRQQALLHAAAELAGNRLRLDSLDAGLQLTAWLPQGADDARVSEAAARRGIDAVPVSRFVLEHRQPPGLVLGFAAYDEERIRGGMAELVAAIDEVVPSRRSKVALPTGRPVG